jgi:GTP-binding protein Era
MTNEQDTRVTTVAFVGQPNVGKSTLLNAMVGTKIAPTTRKPQTTRRIIRGIKTIGNCQQIYFDTPGAIHKKTVLDRFMQEQIALALSDVDQVVAIVDVDSRIKRHLDFLIKIKSETEKNQQKLIIVINKMDELRDRALLLALIEAYSKVLPNVDIIPVSALKSEGLDILFKELEKGAKLGSFLFSQEYFTDASEKEIVGDLIREKAMLELQEELPYRLAVTIENFDESRREDEKKPLVEIDAVIHVERKSQKAIVIGKQGSTLKNIGIRARKELEHLLHCQVMLKLFVRVEPNWTSSSKGMRKLGY